MADAYSIANLNTQTMLEELAKQSKMRESQAATGQQKKSIMTKVSREIEKAQAKAARKARKKSKRYGTIVKLASFGLGFVPGAGLWLSALASSAAENRIARMQQKTLQNLTKNLNLGWMGKTFASEGIKDWKEDVNIQAKEIDTGFGGFAESFAKNAIGSLAMQGITQGISEGIKGAKDTSEIAKIKESLPKGEKFKAGKIYNKANTSIKKFGSEELAQASKFDNVQKFDPAKDIKLEEAYKGHESGISDLKEGDWFAKTSIGEKSSGVSGNSIERFMKGLDKSDFEETDWLKLIAMLSPEESGFDIQSDPMSYIGRYQ